MEALLEVDSALAGIGLRKQVRSPVVPGKEFSTTYEGRTVDRAEIEKILSPLATQRGITLSVEVEESVSFP